MPIPAARIVDANANRAREALRMMEDAARFGLDDAAQSRTLKTLRHELRRILAALPSGWLEANRNTVGDVGTNIREADEHSRTNLLDVVIAAGKRLTEALRVMEETCKTFNPMLAEQLESLRYRAYDAESALLLQMSSGRAVQWRVCVLLTEALCTRPWLEVTRAALDGGADCIQVREKLLDGGVLADRVEAVVTMAHSYRASVIVNDRADVAMIAGASGVHVGRDDLRIEHVRQLAGRSLLIGASTHNEEEAAAAVQAGADYCGVGAMFPTTLKPDRTPSGPGYLQSFIAQHPNTPHLAIGGITLENLDQLVRAGVRGIAVSAAVCRADDPARVVSAMRAQLDEASKAACAAG